MRPETLFQVFSMMAIAGWAALAAGVLLRRPLLRDTIAGRAVPLLLAAFYSLLILLFFASAEGSFDHLANVQKLFTSPWVALAGWVHYLAFDLFIGGWIAREFDAKGLPRWPLILILPLTFLFGPLGLLASQVMAALLQPAAHSPLADEVKEASP